MTTTQQEIARNDSQSSASKTRVCLALFVILAVALGLRLWRLNDESAWWDEVASLKYLDAPSLSDFIREERVNDPAMTPTYFVIEYFWARVVGNDVARMRILSLAMGMSAIAVLFALTKRMFGARAGLFAAMLAALSLAQIYYSLEIRMYALTPLLAAASTFTFIEAFESGRKRWMAAHIALNFLLVFTHLFAVLLPAAQSLFLLAFRRDDKRRLATWFAAHIIIGLCVAVWVLTINEHNTGRALSWLVKPGFRDAVMLWLVFAGGRASNESPAPHLPSGFSLDIAIAGFILALALQATWTSFRCRNKEKRDYILLSAMWLVIPPTALFVVSIVLRPCFMYRYAFYSALPAYVLAGAGLASIKSVWTRRALTVALIALYAHQLSSLAIGPFRADWKSACAYVEAHKKPLDRVLVFQDINLISYQYNSESPDTDSDFVPVWSDLCPRVMEAQNEGRDIWFAVWLWSNPGNLESCFTSNNLEYSHADFNGWPKLRVYHIPAREANEPDRRHPRS
jgi:hypothetical protein